MVFLGCLDVLLYAAAVLAACVLADNKDVFNCAAAVLAACVLADINLSQDEECMRSGRGERIAGSCLLRPLWRPRILCLCRHHSDKHSCEVWPLVQVRFKPPLSTREAAFLQELQTERLF